MERIRGGLQSYEVDSGVETPLRVTASFGVALLDPEIPVELSVEHADAAMYAAKREGKNRSCLWVPTMPSVKERAK